MKNLRLIIFDLDNTLYGYNYPNKIANDSLFVNFGKMFNLSLDEVTNIHAEARRQTHKNLPNVAASHNRLLYVQKMLEIAGKNSIKHSLDFYNIYWDTFLDNATLFPDVINLLEKLNDKEIKICVLTDLTSHIQFRKMNKFGLDKYISTIITSEEVGCEKPNNLMFSEALRKMKCSKNEAIMVGDNFEKDILGAHRFGIKNIWLNLENQSKKVPNSTIVINDFNELEANLELWS